MRNITKICFFSLLVVILLIGGLLPRAEGAPAVAKPVTRLNEAQAVEAARAFCRKIGQPVTIPGTATFATNSQGPPGHYWQPTWDVTFPGKADVEVADATSVITRYDNAAYSVEHFHDSHMVRQEGDPPDNVISKEEALRIAKNALAATGQIEPLQLNGVELETYNAEVTHSHSWGISWYRMSQDVLYNNQHVGMDMDAETGEITYMIMMLPTPPLTSAVKVLSQDDAIAIAASQVVSRFVQQEAYHKETHLEIVMPEFDWNQRHGQPGPSNSTRLAYAVMFIVDGHWLQVYVDTETGEILAGGRDSGPAGRQAAGSVKAPASLPVSQMLKTVQAVSIREKGTDAKVQPFLKFSVKSQPHAVAVLSKTADFHKDSPAETASEEMVLMSKSHAIGVYSYFPATGLVGTGSDWAVVPNEFKVWMQRKIALASAR